MFFFSHSIKFHLNLKAKFNKMSLNENTYKSLNEKFKDRCLAWCENTTSHGISHWAGSENVIIRIMWIMFFFCSTGFCLYFIIQSTSEYFKYETTVSITRIEEMPTIFPAVTVCSLNPFYDVNEYLKHHPDLEKSLNDREYLNDECFNIETDFDPTELIKCSKTNNVFLEKFVDKIQRYIANDEELNETSRFYLGYFLNDMAFSCEYNGGNCVKTTVLDEIVIHWNNKYGNCYTFNSGDLVEAKKTNEKGGTRGLNVEFVVSK